MPATLLELFEGREEAITGKMSATIPYLVMGAADEAAVRSTAIAGIPTAYNGIPRSAIRISEQVNETTWKVIATYEPPESGNGDPVTLENTYQFETGGSTQNIKSGWLTPYRYSTAGSEITTSAIGFDGENVAGVDIVVPQFQWAETYWYPPTFVTEPFKQGIANATGKVNSDTCKGYPPGSVLFLGASGSKQGNGWWQIVWKFAYQENRTNFTIGDITVASKQGWQYMWIRYEDEVSGTGAQKSLIKKAKYVYIEDVYKPYPLASITSGF